MEHSLQVELAHELLEHIDAGTTCLADNVATNPTANYTDPDRLGREMQILFRRYPLMMGLGCRIPEPGDYLTDDVCGVPILMVRDHDGDVRAFLNVCRHRGSHVARGCGHVKRNFVCPYHGWSYDSRGKLVGIPDDRNFDGVDRDAHGLVALPARERFGCIWVQPEAGTSFDIGKELNGLGPELASYEFDNYHHYTTRILHRRMNWKMLIDTFLEAYHFATLRSETVGQIAQTPSSVHFSKRKACRGFRGMATASVRWIRRSNGRSVTRLTFTLTPERPVSDTEPCASRPQPSKRMTGSPA